MTDYATRVAEAQAGNLQAFQALVVDFQDQVTAFAFSWLGDVEMSRDVAQEVFLEAHLCLHQLAEPEAFPGWLRRIVVKRCDRVTRRKQVVIVSDEANEPATMDADPSRVAQIHERSEQLRYAIAALPERQRIVIALQYFGDITGDEIARFLELPLSTVKKRLRDARRKLRDHGEELMQQSLEHLKPSVNGQFSEEIAFFIALRERNYAEMRRLLKASPQLANAEQNWPHELTHQRVLPFPNKATALITAIELDDMEILELLLQAGSDPDGRCGCATGESAVWTAALFNRPKHLLRLLEHGADPNILSAAGNSPLHVAAMRGHTQIARILLDYGADPRALDTGMNGRPPLVTVTPGQPHGRSPAEWASINGFDELARLLDRSLSGDLSASCIAARRHGLIETGIRAIDFFAPVAPRSLIRFPFGAGVGMLVLLGELSLRFAAAENGAVVWTGFAQPPFDKQDFEAEMAEFGLQSHITGELASFKASPEVRRAAFARGIDTIRKLHAEGKQVLAVVLSTQGFEQDVEAVFPELLTDSGPGTITPIVITPFQDRDGSWETLKGPFTAQWTLDRDRANRRLYPAIDPVLSMSSAEVSARHANLRQKVTGVLSDYVDRFPGLSEFDPERSGLQESGELAHRLLRYFSQSFRIAAPFGGAPAEHTPLAAQLSQIDALMQSGKAQPSNRTIRTSPS